MQGVANAQSYNHAIAAFARRGLAEGAEQLLEEMRAAGHSPNVHSYNSLVSARAKRGDIEGAFGVLSAMRKARVPSNVV